MGRQRLAAFLLLVACVGLIPLAIWSSGIWDTSGKSASNTPERCSSADAAKANGPREDRRNQPGNNLKESTEPSDAGNRANDENDPPEPHTPRVATDARDVLDQLAKYVAASDSELGSDENIKFMQAVVTDAVTGDTLVKTYIAKEPVSDQEASRLATVTMLAVPSAPTITFLFNLALNVNTPKEQRNRVLAVLCSVKLGTAVLVEEYLRGVRRVAALESESELGEIAETCVLRLARDRHLGHGQPGYAGNTDDSDSTFQAIVDSIDQDAAESQARYQVAATRRESDPIVQGYRERVIRRLALACAVYGRTGEREETRRAPALRSLLDTYLATSAELQSGVTPQTRGEMRRGVTFAVADRDSNPLAESLAQAVVAACSNQTVDPLVAYLERERSEWETWARETQGKTPEEARQYAKGYSKLLFEVLEWPRDQASLLALADKMPLLHDDNLKHMIKAYAEALGDHNNLLRGRAKAELADAVASFTASCRNRPEAPTWLAAELDALEANIR